MITHILIQSEAMLLKEVKKDLDRAQDALEKAEVLHGERRIASEWYERAVGENELSYFKGQRVLAVRFVPSMNGGHAFSPSHVSSNFTMTNGWGTPS